MRPQTLNSVNSRHIIFILFFFFHPKRSPREVGRFREHSAEKMFGSKRERSWRRMRKEDNEEPHNVHCSTDISRAIKRRRMMTMRGRVARVLDEKDIWRFMMRA